MTDSFAISERDTVLQIVPMFHANGWGIPFAAVMTGARIVFTGRDLQPANIAGLIQSERVTFTAGVPTIWMSLYGYLETHPHDLSFAPNGSLGRLGDATPIYRIVRKETRSSISAWPGA